MQIAGQQIGGLLLDMDGVLYVGSRKIDGASETLDFLRQNRIPFRFITNTTTRTPQALLEKLEALGFEADSDEIFTAVSATLGYLRSRGTPSCFLLLRDEVKVMFDEFEEDRECPEFVVIGDIGASWSYDTLNAVFNMLMRGSNLICMHRNKYWQDEDGLRMDIGAFVAALEYVSSKEALVIGKPSPTFFQQAISSLGLPPAEVAIVGDDIDSDVGGGQACGLQGVLVQTGKFRQDYLDRSRTKPAAVIGSIKDLPKLLGHESRH